MYNAHIKTTLQHDNVTRTMSANAHTMPALYVLEVRMALYSDEMDLYTWLDKVFARQFACEFFMFQDSNDECDMERARR